MEAAIFLVVIKNFHIKTNISVNSFKFPEKIINKIVDNFRFIIIINFYKTN